jgi:peptidoglycan hydrolase CwlO-like protein
MEKLDLILQKLDSLEAGQQKLNLKVQSLDDGQKSLFEGQQVLEVGQKSLFDSQKSLEAGQKSLFDSQKSLETGQKSLIIGQQELNQIASAILHRQDETDAKLESIAMDVHKLYGKFEDVDQKLKVFRNEVRDEFSHFERHNRAIEKDLDRTISRVEILENQR